MDIGKKCLIMGILGALLAAISSPFLIYMVSTGKYFETLVERPTEPYPWNTFGPEFRVISNNTVFPYKVMEFILRPEGKEGYKVTLNINTNGTINVSISSKNSTLNILYTFNAGNWTREPQISSGGHYVLNVTNIEGKNVNAEFKVTEYYSIKKTELAVDVLKTAGASLGFIAGIALLVGALVKLRRAAREARPETAERTVKRRYVEVEEEDY
ncbi:MAG: hypothetical protein QXR44_02535 [Thermoproteota archaeon]